MRWMRGLLLLLALLLLPATSPAEAEGFDITDSSLLTSSYLGGTGTDSITGAVINSQGQVILVGTTTGPLALPGSRGTTTYGTTTTGQGGFIALFDVSASRPHLLYSASFAPGTATVTGITLDASDNIYISGTGFAGFAQLIANSGTYDTELSGANAQFMAKLAPDAQTLIWGSFHPGGTRISLLSGNRPVAGGKRRGVAVLSADGRELVYRVTTDSTDQHSQVSDMVADPVRERIYLIGYAQVAANLQTPFLEAYALGNPQRLWRAYRDAASAITGVGLGANTEGVALGLDNNGNVLGLFATDGGNTVLTRDPRNIQAPNAGLAGAYQASYGPGGGAKASFVASYNPDTGAIIQASFLRALLADQTRTNTLSALDVAVDGDNRVYVTGTTSCCFPPADAPPPRLMHQFVSTYTEGEGFLAIFPPDLGPLAYGSYMGGGTQRETYHALAMGYGQLVLAGETDGDNLLVRSPFQATRGGAGDGIWAVLNNGVRPPPTLFAGPDQTVFAGAPVLLDAVGRYVTSYTWSQIAGATVALTPTNTAATTFTAPANSGTLTFQVVAQGRAGGTLTDTVTVEVQPIRVQAGEDGRAYFGQTGVKLTGAGTGITGYRWTQVAGPPISSPGRADERVFTFTAPTLTSTLTFELVGTGAGGITVTDRVNVEVLPILADAGPDRIVAPGSVVQLVGRGRSSRSVRSYRWEQLAGPTVPLTSTTQVTLTFTAPPLTIAGPIDLAFQLTVTNTLGLDRDIVLVQVRQRLFLPSIRR